MPDDFAQSQPIVENEADGVPGTVISQTFPPDLRWVRRVIHQATDELRSLGYASEEIGSVEIVLAEALNNIVEHAYAQNEKGEISLLIKKRRSSLLFEVCDNGKPMPKGRAPIGNHPVSDSSSDPMPEGGYGWFLIRELVRDLIYDRRDGQNLLIFRMALNASVGEVSGSDAS